MPPKKRKTRETAPSSLSGVLTYEILEDIAEDRFYERGQIYHAQGRVGALLDDGTTVSAKVRGQAMYGVRLWDDNGDLGYFCDCPMGDQDFFCKHCVAVALAWLAKTPSDSNVSPAQADGDEPNETASLRKFLTAQDKDVLVDLLADQAASDSDLRHRLTLKAASKGAKPDLAIFKKSISRAVRTGGDVDYWSVPAYARGIDHVIDSVEDLLRDQQAETVIELCEYALQHVEKAMGQVDDSDGCLGGVLERLQELHLAACNMAKPDPVELARRLYKWETTTEWDTFSGAASRYEHILGEKGLSEYRRLAEAEWKAVPVLRPGQDSFEKRMGRFHITRIMETLARQSGNVDKLIAVMRRDLSSAGNFLEIANACMEAGRHEQALDWAERGLRAFPSAPHEGLRQFVASEYHRLGRHDEAMALIWADFTDIPCVGRMTVLKSHAEETGQWPAWREKAMSHMREQIKRDRKPRSGTRGGWYGLRDHSELVEIFLWEEDSEAAWQEAQAGGCAQHLWFKLAALREKSHPEDAISVYQSHVEPTLRGTNNQSYAAAMKLLVKIRKLMLRIGKGEEFSDYLLALRVDHKRKINFMKLLDAAKWS